MEEAGTRPVPGIGERSRGTCSVSHALLGLCSVNVILSSRILPVYFCFGRPRTAFQQLSHNPHQAAEPRLAACLKWIQTALSEQRTQHICKQEGLGFVACGEEIRVTFLLPAAPSVLENFLLARRSPRRKRCLCDFGFHH